MTNPPEKKKNTSSSKWWKTPRKMNGWFTWEYGPRNEKEHHLNQTSIFQVLYMLIFRGVEFVSVFFFDLVPKKKHGWKMYYGIHLVISSFLDGEFVYESFFQRDKPSSGIPVVTPGCLFFLYSSWRWQQPPHPSTATRLPSHFFGWRNWLADQPSHRIRSGLIWGICVFWAIPKMILLGDDHWSRPRIPQLNNLKFSIDTKNDGFKHVSPFKYGCVGHSQ